MFKTLCSSSPVFMHASLHLLLILLTCGPLAELVKGQECPAECSCFGTFVSCYQFTEQSLHNLPTGANTLVLNGGDIQSFPPQFALKFPQLTLLDIQSVNVETVLNGTFSGLKGLDQLAMTDCRFGSIETGAFRGISAVSQILFSGSEIGTIRSGAFSGLSNIGEFSIWSTKIERVENGAFKGISDLDSFAFYMNNVSTLNRNAFVEIGNLGKADVYMNKFFNARGSAVMPLQAATSDMNMYSNTFPCSCAVVEDFNAPLLKRYLVSQKCTKDGQVFRLSDINTDEVCSAQSSSTTTTTTTASSSTPLSSTTKRSSTTASSDSTTPELTTEADTTTQASVSGSSSSTFHSTPHTGVTDQRSTSPGVTQSGSTDESDPSNTGIGTRSGVVTVVVLVPWMTTIMALFL